MKQENQEWMFLFCSQGLFFSSNKVKIFIDLLCFIFIAIWHVSSESPWKLEGDMGFYPKDHCTLLQWKSLNPYYAGFGSSTWCQFWGVSFKWAVTKTLVICRIILPSHMALGIQSPCQRMIGMSNHLLSKAFSFHYHSQKVIGSLGVFIISHYKNPYKNQSRGCRFVPYRFWETKARDGTGPRDLRYWFPGFGFDSGPNPTTLLKWKFHEDLKTVRVIGAGAAGVVRLVMNKKTGRICRMGFLTPMDENGGVVVGFIVEKLLIMTWQFIFMSFPKYPHP